MGNLNDAGLRILDSEGTAYDLDSYLVDFGRMARGLVTKVKVTLKNVGFTTQDISLECVAHPTNQIGLPTDTYDVADLCLSEDGTFVHVLDIASMTPNQELDLWIRWSVPEDGLPGAGQFAIQMTAGKVIWT